MRATIDEDIAARAVDAWIRHTLPARHSRSSRWMLRKADREISRAETETRTALVRAVLDAKAGEDLCRDTKSGARLFAERLQERSAADALAKIDRLEVVLRHDPTAENRFRPFIHAARNLFAGEGREPARLLQEVCLGLALSGKHRFPWVRRR